jgi:hypothetical protein
MQLPGERGNALAAKRVAANRIPVERNLLAGLEKLAASYAGAAPVATGASTLIEREREREREREGTWWTHTGGGKGLPSKTTVAKTVL